MGQQLARVDTLDEANFLSKILPHPSWIDLHHSGEGGGWTFGDGQSITITSLLRDRGDTRGLGQLCAELDRNKDNEGEATGRHCDSLRQFVCESFALPLGVSH